MLSLYIDLIYCFFSIVRISGRTDILLCKLQNGSEMTAGEEVRLALALAFPSVVSQLVTILLRIGLNCIRVMHPGVTTHGNLAQNRPKLRTRDAPGVSQFSVNPRWPLSTIWVYIFGEK